MNEKEWGKKEKDVRIVFILLNYVSSRQIYSILLALYYVIFHV